jgi:antitoxin component HigA of HigAB toxin-antitoxin module
MNNEEKRILEETRLYSLNHIRNLLPSIKALEEELSELKEEYKGYKMQYEKADHDLAEEDGRLMKVAMGKSGKAKKLTMEQVKNVAKQLGIKL